MKKLVYMILIGIALNEFAVTASLAQKRSLEIDTIYTKPKEDGLSEFLRLVFNFSGIRKSYALVIGIGEYTNGFPRLEAPYNDAMRVKDFLLNDAGFDQVYLLTNAAASKDRINKLMEETFPKLLGKDDRFLFYFSGHGTQREVGGGVNGYLPLANSGLTEYGTMISMELVEYWDRLLSQTRQVLFLLDACFSGLAGRQLKSALEDKRLARLSQYAHHLITAGSANEKSVASLQRWGGSLFTDAFLRGASGLADTKTQDFGEDQIISLKELVDYIEKRIDTESAKNRSIKMSPQMSHLQENIGEFFFTAQVHRDEPSASPTKTPLPSDKKTDLPEKKENREAVKVSITPVELNSVENLVGTVKPDLSNLRSTLGKIVTELNNDENKAIGGLLESLNNPRRDHTARCYTAMLLSITDKGKRSDSLFIKRKIIETYIDTIEKIDSYQVRQNVISRLITLKANEAEKKMIQMAIYDDNSQVRQSAIGALEKIGTNQVEIAKTLRRIMKYDDDYNVRARAINAIGNLNFLETIPELIAIIMSSPIEDEYGEQYVRGAAMQALGKFQAKEAVEPLLKILDSPENSVNVIQYAVDALIRLNDSRAVSPLTNVMNKLSSSDGYTEKEIVKKIKNYLDRR